MPGVKGISSAIKTIRAANGNHAACSPFSFFIQVSQVTSGPRRGATFNNRWWNDRREWNLRTTNSREKASPKGANHTQSCPCSPPLGTIGECVSAIRRFHDLRSFHPRLFIFAPFGDGRKLHAKLLLNTSNIERDRINNNEIESIITRKNQ